MTNAFERIEPRRADVDRTIPGLDWFDIYNGSKHAVSISADAGLASITALLNRALPNLDYAEILPPEKRVVFFGERHDDLTQKSETIASLSELKAKEGLTHVALEILNDEDLQHVQDYFAGKENREVLLNRIRTRWSVAPGVPEKYLNLIDAVKSAGLIPIALDEKGSALDHHSDSPLLERNERWAGRLADVLKRNNSAKILVYSGRDHVGYGASKEHANELLASKYGYGSNVVVLSSAIDDQSKLPGRLAAAAERAGLKSKAFALKIREFGTGRPGDYILHQPQ